MESEGGAASAVLSAGLISATLREATMWLDNAFDRYPSCRDKSPPKRPARLHCSRSDPCPLGPSRLRTTSRAPEAIIQGRRSCKIRVRAIRCGLTTVKILDVGRKEILP